MIKCDDNWKSGTPTAIGVTVGRRCMSAGKILGKISNEKPLTITGFDL
ncbi:MAG: hypothetical protein WCA39_13695 [Nitrososphaeraceae archaeon]